MFSRLSLTDHLSCLILISDSSEPEDNPKKILEILVHPRPVLVLPFRLRLLRSAFHRFESNDPESFEGIQDLQADKNVGTIEAVEAVKTAEIHA